MTYRGRIAIIPARGGSKRIPRKNIKSFHGLPLLARTVNLLQGTGLFERIVVSTDAEEVMTVAREAGAEVPFRRPHELADDLAPTAAVMEHAVERLLEDDGGVSRVCCVYPAAVFTTDEDLAGALSLLESTDADVVMSATTFDFPIQRALRLTPDGSAEMIWPEHRLTRSQDLEETYHDAGQFYWAGPDHWLADGQARPGGRRLYLIPRWRVQDIDTPEDWARAEVLFELLQRRGELPA